MGGGAPAKKSGLSGGHHFFLPPPLPLSLHVTYRKSSRSQPAPSQVHPLAPGQGRQPVALLLLLIDCFVGHLNCTNRRPVTAAMARSKLACCGAWGSDRCKCPEKKAKKTKKDFPDKPLQSAETDRLALQVELEQLRVQRLRLEERKRSEKEAEEKAAEKKGSPVNKSQWSHHSRWGQQGSRYNRGGSGSCQRTYCPYPSRSYHP